MVERTQRLLYVATGVLGSHPDLSRLLDEGSTLGIMCVLGRDLAPIFGLIILADIRGARTYEWSMPPSAMTPLQDLRPGLIEGSRTATA